MRQFTEEYHVDWGLGHCFYANMGGFVAVDKDKVRNIDGQTDEIMADPFPLTAFSIHLLRSTEQPRRSEEGPSEPHENKKSTMLENLSNTTTTELYDKSKGDIFVKGYFNQSSVLSSFANHCPS
jgi:hypothetical protein